MHRSPRRLRIALFGLLALLVLPSSGALAGEEDTGQVTFRLTLQGEVEPDDGFVIDVRCDGGDFCNGADEERFVYFCAHPIVVDTVRCEADEPIEFTVSIPPQQIEWYLYRNPNVLEPEPESRLILSGTTQVREGTQTIALGYRYPGAPAPAPTPAPALPDTAMPMP